MFKINSEEKIISITRGDIGSFDVGALNQDETDYVFKVGDVVRFKVFDINDYTNVKLQKDVVVEEETTIVRINLEGKDTRIDGISNKIINYAYEIELNPDTNPQTIIGYDDESGEKTFKLYPEGGDE